GSIAEALDSLRRRQWDERAALLGAHLDRERAAPGREREQVWARNAREWDELVRAQEQEWERVAEHTTSEGEELRATLAVLQAQRTVPEVGQVFVQWTASEDGREGGYAGLFDVVV